MRDAVIVEKILQEVFIESLHWQTNCKRAALFDCKIKVTLPVLPLTRFVNG